MPRIRDFGVMPGYLETGPLNAITDVPGVRVGHTTVKQDVNGDSASSGPVAEGSVGAGCGMQLFELKGGMNNCFGKYIENVCTLHLTIW